MIHLRPLTDNKIKVLIGTTLSIFSLLLFVKVLSEVLESDFTLIDTTIWNFFYSIRSLQLNSIMLRISFLGGEFIIAGAIIVAGFLLIQKRLEEALFLVTTFFGATLLDVILKISIHRSRPTIAPLLVMHDYSFPSGHAMSSFVFYMALAYLAYNSGIHKSTKVLIAVCASFLIALIGISRIYLGVHFASDVLAGYIAGFWWFSTILTAKKTIASIHKVLPRAKQHATI